MSAAKHTPTPDGKRCALHEVVYLKFPSGSVYGGFIRFGCIICVTAHRDELHRSHNALVAALDPFVTEEGPEQIDIDRARKLLDDIKSGKG